MKTKLNARFLLAIYVAVTACPALAQKQIVLPSYLMEDYSQRGRELPPGVPREVDTSGNLVYIPADFSTAAYKKAAFHLVIEEASQVAQELKLPESVPLEKTNIAGSFIGTFGFNYGHRMIGTVTTKKYCYYVSRGDKFSEVCDTHEQEHCREYLAEGYAWPVSQIDTNAAYQLATQWLSAVHMDIAGLNRDCRMSVTVDSVYAQAPPGKFIPTYWVAWIPSDNVGIVAAVRLFAPTKTLLDLTVEDPKYILRKPVVFTNLAALFPGVAPIRTNYPTPTIYLSAPPP